MSDVGNLRAAWQEFLAERGEDLAQRRLLLGPMEPQNVARLRVFELMLFSVGYLKGVEKAAEVLGEFGRELDAESAEVGRLVKGKLGT